MSTGVGQNGHVARFTKRRRFTTGVVDPHLVMGEQTINTPADDAVPHQPDRHGASPSAMLIGLQPPCWGGVPPRPFTLRAAAAAPVMTNAVMILRSTFTAPLLPFVSSTARPRVATSCSRANGPSISAIHQYSRSARSPHRVKRRSQTQEQLRPFVLITDRPVGLFGGGALFSGGIDVPCFAA